MNAGERDDLLIYVLRAMLWKDAQDARYALQCLGESLVTEYRDLKATEIHKKLEKYE